MLKKAYDRKYGARPLRRKLQDEVEDRLADALIRGEIHTGESCDRDDEEQGNHCIKR